MEFREKEEKKVRKVLEFLRKKDVEEFDSYQKIYAETKCKNKVNGDGSECFWAAKSLRQVVN